MYKEANRPAWAEINLANAAFNIQNIKAKLGPNVQIMGIIKADGYGHGAIPMAMVLKENGVKSFGVAALSEAIALRDAGITEEIVILGLTPDLYIDILLKYDLTPVTASFENASAISEAALQENKVVHGFVAVDSGMGRIGYLPDDPASIDEVIKISRLDGFKIKGLFPILQLLTRLIKTMLYYRKKDFWNSVRRSVAWVLILQIRRCQTVLLLWKYHQLITISQGPVLFFMAAILLTK